MFRGGDYVDKPEFYNKSKIGHNYMRTDDIDGAKPRPQFQSRNKHIGASILEPYSMTPAGGSVIDKNVSGSGVAGLFSTNHQKMDKKRDPLSTHDINGGIRRNQYGAKLEINQDNIYQKAGQVKMKNDKIY